MYIDTRTCNRKSTERVVKFGLMKCVQHAILKINMLIAKIEIRSTSNTSILLLIAVGYMFRHLKGHHQTFYWNKSLKYCLHYWDPINFIVDRSRLHVSTLRGSSSGLLLEQVFKILRTSLGSH